MTTKELLEIIILVIGGGGAASAGAFAFAINKHNIQLEKHINNLKKLELAINQQSFTAGRKQQQNIDSILVQVGVLQCDIRDIKGVLIQQGLLHDRAGFPEKNIPKRTDWSIIEDA